MKTSLQREEKNKADNAANKTANDTVHNDKIYNNKEYNKKKYNNKEYNDKAYNISADIYEPREDSFLLAEQVKKFAFGKVLDMGTGSGVQALAAAKLKRVKKVFGVDINKSAVDFCRKNISNKKIKNKIKFVLSDLFSAVSKKTKFDTIIFNPPYLPEEREPELKDLALDGGKEGYEIIERFLSEAGKFLKPKGIILLLFSSLTNKEKVDRSILKNLFSQKQISSKHIFFEDLYVYKIEKNPLAVLLEKKGVKNIEYLAKGSRGIVYTGIFKAKKVCIKAKNQESKAEGRIKNEADALLRVNKKSIGPKLLFAGNGFVCYEFAEGRFLEKWLEDSKTKKTDVKKVFRQMLLQCFAMDKLGIDKEEMHRPLKNAIVSAKNKLTLIDFERAHKTKKPKNTTQFCRFLISRKKQLAEKGIKINKRRIISLARVYKQNMSKNNLDKIIASYES